MLGDCPHGDFRLGFLSGLFSLMSGDTTKGGVDGGGLDVGREVIVSFGNVGDRVFRWVGNGLTKATLGISFDFPLMIKKS